jgi:hypothetical protein
MIVRVSANYEKMIAKDLCGEKAENYYDVIVYSADGRPMFTVRACEVSVDGLPVTPKTFVLVEAVRVLIEGTKVWISTPISHEITDR